MTILLDDTKIIERLMATMLFAGDSEEVLAPYETDDVAIGSEFPFNIYDLFLTDRGVGEIDGTLCEPSGQRESVDAGGDITISGQLTFSGGTGVYGQCYVVFKDTDGNGTTRAAGITIEFDVTHTSGAFWVGLNRDDTPASDGAPGTVDHDVFFASAGDIYTSTGGALADSGYNWQVGVKYRIKFVLKATGASTYISGGGFGTFGEDFTLLADDNAESTDPLYVSISNYDGVFVVHRVLVYEG